VTAVGRLVLVATPIGNLGDLSPRVRDALAAADAVVCEDTRRTGLLLQHLGVSGKTYIVANEHTEATAAGRVADRLASGETIAVVTDAGLPGVSDPGERLVRAALSVGAEVTVIPGPSAGISALAMSGLPTDRFVMEGFLPRSGGERRTRLAEVAGERRTIVLYEAPHRLQRTLADLAELCGPDRPVALVRELTKLHEEAWRGSLADAIVHGEQHEPRGEYVVVLGGAAPEAAATDDDLSQAVRDAFSQGLKGRDAADTVATALGIPRRRAYAAVLAERGT
jgi:16S rRNA (cytidine1402-2'-O)-methyltransferase